MRVSMSSRLMVAKKLSATALSQHGPVIPTDRTRPLARARSRSSMLGAGQWVEPTRRLTPRPIEHRVDVLDHLVRRRVLQPRVGTEPVTHQCRVVAAEHRSADVPVLVIKRASWGEAKLVNRLGSV